MPGDKRQAALKEIDEADFGWQHVRACLVAGTGFFMDAYDLYAIGFASTMIGLVYFNDPTLKTPGKTPSEVDLGLKVSANIGTLLGQLFFGFLADRLGRKRMYGVELMIIIVATVASALCGGGVAVTLVNTLIFWRVIMGVGIGGDYPLSAIITSEFATKKRRGAMMGSVFAMQGFGFLASSLVALIVVLAYGKRLLTVDPPNTALSIDYCWRLVLGLGAVPGLLALYFRLTIPETPRYTMDVEHNYDKATADIGTYLQKDGGSDEAAKSRVQTSVPKASWSDFVHYFGQWKNGKILLGTAATWFALDVAFYGTNLNNNLILSAIGFADVKGSSYNESAYLSLRNAAIGNIIVNLLGTVPGYWVTVLFVDKWGRRPIQIGGFAILTVLFAILGGAYEKIKASTPGFIVIFTLIQFFLNFGPNTTTFIIPGEVFPTRYRSTGHGISAAAGKLGAIISLVGFAKLKDRGGPLKFVGPLLLIFAAFMFVGLLFAFLVPETKGLSLEELSNEEQSELEDVEVMKKSEV